MYCIRGCDNIIKRLFNKIPKNLNFKELNYFYPPIKKGRVIRVYDGDTITIAATVPLLKNRDIYKFSIRLNRIDCPEIKTTNSDEKLCGLRVRDLLSEKIMNKMVKIEILKTDKYGRYLAEIYYKRENISDWLLSNRYAIPYDGGKKEDFSRDKFTHLLVEDSYIDTGLVTVVPLQNPNGQYII